MAFAAEPVDWGRLQSGTDLRGRAFSELGSPAVLTEAVGLSAGAGFALWLGAQTPREGPPTVAVGCDSRVTGDLLKAAVARGLMTQGVRVLDCGLCTTPAMFMTTVLLQCDAAVMVTASHMPWQQNGYKFITRAGGVDSAQLREILNIAQAHYPLDGPEPEAFPESVAFLGQYEAYLGETARAALGAETPLAGLHVVVDAGNGAGGFYAGFLSSLGANVQGSQFLEPDGRFPHHAPNPEAPEAMEAIAGAVKRAGADLGVIFDADCDRAALVDRGGRAMNRNRLIALVSAVLLRERPGAAIVTDSVASYGLEAFIEARGGTLHRFKRGYRNVIEEAERLNREGMDCPLAMETSGHAALRENYFLDDGMYLATRLVVEAARRKRAGESLSALLTGFMDPAEALEVRLPIAGADFAAVGRRILDSVAAAAEDVPGWRLDPRSREGVRVMGEEPDTWFLLRLSVHEPLLVVNAESGHAGGVRCILTPLGAQLAQETEVDQSALEARLLDTKHKSSGKKSRRETEEK